jgi:hypothetical protein
MKILLLLTSGSFNLLDSYLLYISLASMYLNFKTHVC